MKDILRYIPNFYNDIPIAYVVYKVEYNAKKTMVKDAIISYVNDDVCKILGKEQEDIVGKSFQEIFPNADDIWKDDLYKCLYKKERRHNFTYALDLGYWIAYAIGPNEEEGYCSCVFFNIDEENKKSEELKKAFMTDNIIIRIAKLLNSDIPYNTAMNQVMKELGKAIDSDRIYVLETDGIKVDNAFEYTKDGVYPSINTLKNIPLSAFRTWLDILEDRPFIEINDVESLIGKDLYLYDLLNNLNVSRLFAYPLYNEGKLIGFLVVDNYIEDTEIDAEKIIEDASHFISSRVGNHVLVKRLEKASKYDALTGLLNRFGFNEKLAEFYEKNKDSNFIYAVMDIDDFKTINDLYGHPVGDIALKAFAKSLTREFGAKAIIGRTGGDEFCLILKDNSKKNVEDILNSFVAKEKTYSNNGVKTPFTISLGYTIYPFDGKKLVDLYSKADSALYYVKFHSKNGCDRYNATMMLGERQRIGFSMKEITENVPGVIFIYEAKSERMLYANLDCIRMFDCKDIDEFMEYVDYKFKGVVHPSDYERVDKEIWEQIHSGKTENRDYVRYKIITKTGRIKHVRDFGHLVHDDRYGEIFYVLLVNEEGNDL